MKMPSSYCINAEMSKISDYYQCDLLLPGHS